MQANTVRTTVDLKSDTAHRLKEFAVRHGLTQKKVISHALTHYLGSKGIETDANKTWQQLRRLSQKGKQNIDLIQALRNDRSR